MFSLELEYMDIQFTDLNCRNFLASEQELVSSNTSRNICIFHNIISILKLTILG